jgi:hypothetical protein
MFYTLNKNICSIYEVFVAAFILQLTEYYIIINNKFKIKILALAVISIMEFLIL